METAKEKKIKETILAKTEAVKEDIAAYKSLTQPISPDNASAGLPAWKR